MDAINNQQVKSKRDNFSARLKEKYPDREFVDDEAMFGQISDDYDEYDNQIAGYKEREKKFADMFSSDPDPTCHLLVVYRVFSGIDWTRPVIIYIMYIQTGAALSFHSVFLFQSVK